MGTSPCERRTKRLKLDPESRKENLTPSVNANTRSKRQYFNYSKLPRDNLASTSLTNPQAATKAKAASAPPQANAILGPKDPNVIGASTCNTTISTQDFQLNIRTPVKRIKKRVLRTPNSGSLDSGSNRPHQSSDDSIFWAVTPIINKDKQNALNQVDISLGSVPSSPIKEESPAVELLDPKLRTLLDKYNNTFEGSPTLPRSISDPNSFSNKKTPPDDTTEPPIMATKQSLTESMIQSINKIKASKKLSFNSFGTEPVAPPTSVLNKPPQVKKSVSQLLMQIGSNLSTKKDPYEDDSCAETDINNDFKEPQLPRKDILDGLPLIPDLPSAADPSAETIQKQPLGPRDKKKETGENGEDDQDDTFSDVDMDELDMLSTQVKHIRIQKQEQTTCSGTDASMSSATSQIEKELATNVSDSEDSFSDDGDEIIEIVKAQQLKKQSQENSTSNVEDTNESEDPFSDDDEEELNSLFNRKPQEPRTAPIKSLYRDMKMDIGNQQVFTVDEAANNANSCIMRENCHRFQIKQVVQTKFKRNNQLKDQLILKCVNSDNANRNLVIRDQWMELDFQINDVVHVVTDSTNDNPQLVDKDNNLLIWNPDILLSATLVSESVDCKRKAVLNTRLQGPGVDAAPLVIGTIIHALFQECLITKDLSDKFIDEFIDNQLDLYFVSILSIGIERSKLRDSIMEQVDYIKTWIDTYIPLPTSALPTSAFRQRTEFKATNVLDVEENIWSPMFGLRGLIDVVVEARLNNGNKHVVPLEIKSGREYISNRAQVSLYTLLVKQRYGVDSDSMSLVYTKMKQCYFEALKENDMRTLINIRNHISQYMKYGIRELPPIKKQASCERCFSINECMTYNKLMEDGTAFDSGIEESIYDGITAHIDRHEHNTFFNHWDTLLTKEEGLMNSFKKDLWCLSSRQREFANGKSIGNLTVTLAQEVGGENGSHKRFLYTFQRDVDKYPPMTLTQLAKYDRIILSDEDGNFGLAFGFVESVRPDFIIVSTDRKFINSQVKLPNFDAAKNQVFQSVLASFSQNIDDAVKSKKYRVDKDEMFHGLAMARFNLLNLFLPEGDAKRRQLIVDLQPPQFASTPIIDAVGLDKSKFNPDQLSAFDKVLKTKDYSLILGMPGTGKTTVIGNLIKFLVEAGMTVLIASYTHSAVDNIIEKVMDLIPADKLSLLRVGSPTSVKPKVKPYCINYKDSIYPMQTKEDFNQAFLKTQIVATTCLGIKDTVFAHRQQFDFCIIDEASQVSMPVCLGPLRFADRFVLVGDHYQLPPLILNTEARNGGLDKSLFKILSEKFPQSVVELSYQYRMCSDIMLISNTLIYEGRLKCGNEKVANQVLTIPYKERLCERVVNIPVEYQWMNEIMKETNNVIFVNHDGIKNAREVQIGDKIENPTESKLIVQMIHSLLLTGVEASSIGVMSFYRAQLRHFHRALGPFPDLEILTADQFQGRDKPVIIISLVRSNNKNVAGDLLREWRRVNVAMTRAKCKLIIVGSKSLMKTVAQFEGFMDLVECKKWCLDLKDGEEKAYEGCFLEFSQTSQHRGVNLGSGSSSSSPTESKKKPAVIVKAGVKSKAVQRTHVLKHVLSEMEQHK